MLSKRLLSFFFAALLVSVCATAVAAQNVSTATGRVILQQADGKKVPLKGATVSFYRLDVKGEYKATTGDDGRYSIANIPRAGTYAVIVSGPGAQPSFVPGIKLSVRDANDFPVEPGDGSTPSDEQIQEALRAAAASGGDANAIRRAREEDAKARAAAEQARTTNANLNTILKAGNQALNSKKYDEAIAAYDQGIQADATQGVFFRNKAIALYARGLDRYNAAVANKDAAAKKAGLETARSDMKMSVEMAEKAVAAARAGKSSAAGQGNASSPAGGGGASQGRNEELEFLSTRAESYRLAMRTNAQVDGDAAVKAIQEYVAAETDAAKKDKAQAGLALAMLQSGKTEESAALSRQILASNPNNLDAMYVYALALASDESKLNDAREAFQRFIAKAPETDARKQEAQQIVEGLKAAPATNTNRGTRRRGN